MQKAYWRINHNIHAPRVRVIGEDGKQLGVLTITEALEKAKEAELDLVEIAPKAIPPVTRIIEFGKFKYLEEKKLKALKKKTKSSETKEIRFSPFIGEADYNTRLEKIRGFLKDKNKVRVVVKFKGRQMGSKQFGYKLIEKILTDLGELVTVDMNPKFVGRHLTMVISSVSKAKRKIGTGEQESRKV
ncbi:translation initiation factor IF-3 [Patescibacteria group bacterium]|nr:translation initiation factor IF-3 [Patescibacteria group bacterium]